MQLHIPLLFVLVTIGGSTVGCATSSIEELTAEAKKCVDTSINELGVIGASDEQRTACWVPVNKKIEAQAKWEKRQQERRGASCGNGLLAWCDTWGRCQCVSQEKVRETLRRVGLY